MPPDIDVLLDVDASVALFRAAGFEQSVHGVRTWKFADDLRRYQAVIEASRPEVVVETGTFMGGSALWFADLGVDVVTVDVDMKRSRQAQGMTDRVTWVLGASSVDPTTVDRVRQLVDGRRCMVSLDSEHHAPHVIAEIEAYAPMVSPGCHLVVEDGLADLAGQLGRQTGARIPEVGGPLAAIVATVATWSGWARDEQIECLTPVTHNQAGWWRRDA